jgi:hypothetical protein
MVNADVLTVRRSDAPLDYFYLYLRIELSHIDEIRDGEFGMVEEVMKLHQQVHVLRQSLIKTRKFQTFSQKSSIRNEKRRSKILTTSAFSKPNLTN